MRRTLQTALEKPAKSKKEQKRDAILDAAQELILASGGSFEIGDLARKAGISNGLAYHYFRSKDGVIAGVIDRFYDRYETVVDERMDPEVAWELRERHRLERVVEFLFSDPLAPVLFGSLSHRHAVERDMRSQRAMMANAAYNIRSGQQRGQISGRIDAELAGAAITGAVRATTMMALSMQPRPAASKVAAQIWQLIASAVGLDAKKATKTT